MARVRPAWLALCLMISACGTEDVVVAEHGDSGPPPDAGVAHPGQPCTSNSDCRANEFCAKRSCAEASGGCELRPVFCDTQGPPTCGCDGATYWNDCLRRRMGIAAGSVGECSVGALACDEGSACAQISGSCARLLPERATCDQPPRGACWVLPDVCPTGAPPPDQPAPPAFLDCALGSTCRSLCDAIRTESVHVAAPAATPTCPAQ